MSVRRRIGTKRQIEFLCGGAQLVEHNSRLHASIFFAMIQLENLIAVLRKIENDGKVATLTAQAGTTAAREHGSFKNSTEAQRGDCVFDISWQNDAYWNLPIIGAVGRVERTISVAESHLAFDHVL